jgi:hypothetical protein
MAAVSGDAIDYLKSPDGYMVGVRQFGKIFFLLISQPGEPGKNFSRGQRAER